MTIDTVVRARIDTKTKEQATKALEAMGLSISDYIRMALARVAHDQAIPFPVKVPNKLTTDTIGKAQKGEGIHTATDVEDLFNQLEI